MRQGDGAAPLDASPAPHSRMGHDIFLVRALRGEIHLRAFARIFFHWVSASISVSISSMLGRLGGDHGPCAAAHRRRTRHRNDPATARTRPRNSARSGQRAARQIHQYRLSVSSRPCTCSEIVSLTFLAPGRTLRPTYAWSCGIPRLVHDHGYLSAIRPPCCSANSVLMRSSRHALTGITREEKRTSSGLRSSVSTPEMG